MMHAITVSAVVAIFFGAERPVLLATCLFVTFFLAFRFLDRLVDFALVVNNNRVARAVTAMDEDVPRSPREATEDQLMELVRFAQKALGEENRNENVSQTPPKVVQPSQPEP